LVVAVRLPTLVLPAVLVADRVSRDSNLHAVGR
jgi:hypothetical protein